MTHSTPVLRHHSLHLCDRRPRLDGQSRGLFSLSQGPDRLFLSHVHIVQDVLQVACAITIGDT